MTYRPRTVLDAFAAPVSDYLSGNTSATAAVLTASSTPHADVAWTEWEPSLSAPISGLAFAPTGSTSTAATDTSTLLEIATGTAGNEVLWARISVGYFSIAGGHIFVPGHLAAGTRISLRLRSAVASKAITFLVTPMGVRPGGQLSAPTTYGGASMDTTSRGITLTAPGALNTKGDWTEMSASTSEPIAVVSVGVQGAAGTTMAGNGIYLDIGYGPDGSEQSVISDLYIQGSTSENYSIWTPSLYAFLLSDGRPLPAGERLVARYQRASASNAVDLTLVTAGLA